jgi:uncharacterized protein YjbI with pentapeptide repeats
LERGSQNQLASTNKNPALVYSQANLINSKFYRLVKKGDDVMAKPMIFQNPLYDLIRTEQIDEFNNQTASGKSTVGLLNGGDYRGLDLRNLNADGLDFRDAYFRGADLRGIDFRKATLEGASFCQAQVSGCYFPKEILPEELRLSIDIGIRIRYRNV